MFHMDLPTLYFSLMFWKLTEKTIYKKLAALAVAAGVASKETPEEEAALNFIQAVKDMKGPLRNRRYHPGNPGRRHSEAVTLCGQRGESAVSGTGTDGCTGAGEILLYADAG